MPVSIERIASSPLMAGPLSTYYLVPEPYEKRNQFPCLHAFEEDPAIPIYHYHLGAAHSKKQRH